jgi:hypothetical protein
MVVAEAVVILMVLLLLITVETGEAVGQDLLRVEQREVEILLQQLRRKEIMREPVLVQREVEGVALEELELLLL